MSEDNNHSEKDPYHQTTSNVGGLEKTAKELVARSRKEQEQEYDPERQKSINRIESKFPRTFSEDVRDN